MPGFLSFTLRKREKRGIPFLSSGNRRRPSPSGGDGRSAPTNQGAVLSKWRGLRDIKSANHLLNQLELLVNAEESRSTTLKFKGKDAAVVINVIDKALKQGGVSEETRLHALKILRKLAGNTRQVPESYLINKRAKYTVKENIIGNGGFADIREGILGKNVVAVKTIRISQKTDVKLIHKIFCKESVLWMNVSHPNILKLIAVEIKPHVNRFSMITELMSNGNIMEYIQAKEADRLSLLKDTINGLQHLHALGIVHGDLKGPNILINNEAPPQACISDFGLCVIAPWMTFDPTTRKSAGGTFGYMAPELFLEDARYTKEADMYAFGMVVYEVVTGTRSFGHRRLVELPVLTSAGSRPTKPEDPLASGFGQGTWELMEKCWGEDPTGRPTAVEARQHFKGVAAVSTLVDPSPVPQVQGTNEEIHPGLDASSRNFSGLFPQ